MSPRKLFLPVRHSPLRRFYIAVCRLNTLLIGAEVEGQTNLTSAGAGDRTLESGFKEYAKAISNPPYPGLKGLEAVRDSLLETTPELKNVDLRIFVDHRFVKAVK